MPFFVHPTILSIWHPSIAGNIGHFAELGTEMDAQLGRRRYGYERSSKAHEDLDGASNKFATRAGCGSMRIPSRLTLN